MSVLKPNVSELGEVFIKCPKCGGSHSFKIFYTNVSLAYRGVSILPFNRKYTALCLGCKGIFTLNAEKGNSYLQNRDIAITAEDLELRNEENAPAF